MINISARRSVGHDVCDFAAVGPAGIAKGLCHRMLVDIPIPSGCTLRGDTGTCFVVPMPARVVHKHKDNLKCFSKLKNIQQIHKKKIKDISWMTTYSGSF